MTPDAPPAPEFGWVTRTVKTPYTVRMCQNGRCWLETRYKESQVREWGPLNTSLPAEAKPTPWSEVRRTVDLLRPQRNETFVDFGCGFDARFCVDASKRYGCRSIGVEIDPQRAESARKYVKALGLDKLVTIVTGDANEVDVTGDVGVVYLFPDDAAKLKPRLMRMNRFASVQHAIPGVRMANHNGVHVWRKPRPVAVWGGRQYTGRLCNNPFCQMCASIQNQLAGR